MILFRKGLSKGIDGQLMSKDLHYMLSPNTESDELYDRRFPRTNRNRTGNKRLDFIPNTTKSISLWMDVYASEGAELCSKLTRIRIYYEPVTPNQEWKIEAAERLESTRWQPMLVNGELIAETEPDASNIIFVRTVVSNFHILDRIYGNPAWSTPRDRDALTRFVTNQNLERAKRKLKVETSDTDSGLNQSAKSENTEQTELKDLEHFSPPRASTFIAAAGQNRLKLNNNCDNKRKRANNYGPFSQNGVWLSNHDLLRNTPEKAAPTTPPNGEEESQESWRKWLAK